MQKSAPSVGRILIAVLFTLSCFGLLLFLWVAFGGPVPLKAESYRVTAYFPEATQLAPESDVRIGGVSVGKVKTVELAPIEKQIDGLDTTEAVIEIEPEFAPLSSDARAILRNKTLLGETYVELTSGTEPGEKGAPLSLGAAANNSDGETDGIEAIPEGGSMGLGQVEDQTQIDEIFNALDTETRTAFQRWQQGLAVAVKGRSLDLNDALGNLGPFIGDASDVLGVLRKQKTQLQGLVRDTGTVFDALSERNQALAGAITGSNETFEALASEEAGAPRPLPGRADLRGGDDADPEPPRRVPGEHEAAGPGPAPGRQRHQPDAAQRPPPLSEPRVPLLRPRRPDQGVAPRFPGAGEHAQGPAPGARLARPVPGEPRSGRQLAQLLPLEHHRLPLEPAGGPLRHAHADPRTSPRPGTC